jgi:hypothetical protein
LFLFYIFGLFGLKNNSGERVCGDRDFMAINGIGTNLGIPGFSVAGLQSIPAAPTNISSSENLNGLLGNITGQAGLNGLILQTLALGGTSPSSLLGNISSNLTRLNLPSPIMATPMMLVPMGNNLPLQNSPQNTPIIMLPGMLSGGVMPGNSTQNATGIFQGVFSGMTNLPIQSQQPQSQNRFIGNPGVGIPPGLAKKHGPQGFLKHQAPPPSPAPASNPPQGMAVIATPVQQQPTNMALLSSLLNNFLGNSLLAR